MCRVSHTSIPGKRSTTVYRYSLTKESIEIVPADCIIGKSKAMKCE